MDRSTQNPIATAKILRVDCPSAIYLATTGDERGKLGHILSRSDLMNFASCPQRWRRGYEDIESTKSTEFGSLVDCLALTPKQFDDHFALRPDTYPDTKTGEAKKWTMASNWCKDWAAKHAGRQLVSNAELDEAKAAVERLTEHELTHEILENSLKQVMVLGEFKDEATGITVPIKGMIDIVPSPDMQAVGKCLADLKTSTCAAPGRPWTKSVFNFGYHVQAALYLDLFTRATSEDRNTFLHLIVENFAPWEPGRRVLSSEFIELGRSTYVSSLRSYCHCLKENDWPGYEIPSKCLPSLPGFSIESPEPWMLQGFFP